MQATGGIQHHSNNKGNGRINMQQGIHNGQRFPPYVFGKSKRIRNKNWELLEIQVLKKMIDNHYELLNSRHTNAMMNARKNLVWKRIADSINALGLHRRTIRELKIKWSNMRLTERRKSGNSTTVGSDTSTQGSTHDQDNSLSIVDISQSSFEDDTDLNQDNEPDSVTQNDSTGESQERNEMHGNVLQSTSRSVSESIWATKHNNRYTDSGLNQRGHIQAEYSDPKLPLQIATNNFSISNSSQPNISPMSAKSNRDKIPQMTTSFDFDNSTRSNVSKVSKSNLNQIQGSNFTSVDNVRSFLDKDFSNEDPRLWHQENYEVRNANIETTSIVRPKENIHDFSKDKIYMPGVVIKEDPDALSGTVLNSSGETILNVREWRNTSIQTDWRLSCIREYPCPSLPVSEKDITAIKYEILKLERSQLALKNENIELQNTKLRLEIANMQSNI